MPLLYCLFLGDRPDPIEETGNSFFLLKDTAQMLTTTSYIHLNPVRASMVNRPEEYEYSSYSMYIGKKEEKLISSEKILSCFKYNNKSKLYQDFVESDIRLKADVITVACSLTAIPDKLDSKQPY